MIDGHGDDIHKYGNKIISNFSSNIYTRQNSDTLQKYLYAKLKSIHSYPEPDAYSLTTILSDKLHISTDNILVTNGATEAIYLIAQCYRESKTAIMIPTFSEYEDACRINNHELSFYTQMQDIDKDIDTVWICNPNNPNGKIYDIDLLKSLVKSRPRTLFIFDQSYASFTNSKVWNVSESTKYENVVLLHSMTKEFAIPGLRLGYITANKQIIGKINTLKMPWSVNSLAIEAGKFSLQNREETFSIDNYIEESQYLQNELKKIEALEIIPSSMHYFLCRLKNKKASDLKNYLIEKHGILIRDASNFRGLDKHYFRIATQSRAENKQLINAIKGWI